MNQIIINHSLDIGNLMLIISIYRKNGRDFIYHQFQRNQDFQVMIKSNKEG